MAKVKPYIITIKYVSFYEDPRPTVEQIANELNMDALEIIIEDAVVTAATKAAQKPTVEYDVDSRTVTYHNLPETTAVEAPTSAPAPAAVTTSEVFKKEEAPFDTYNLDRTGPSIKVLSTLYKAGKKGRTMKDIREVTQLGGPAANTAVSRLKSAGRIKVIGKGPDGASIYGFVK